VRRLTRIARRPIVWILGIHALPNALIEPLANVLKKADPSLSRIPGHLLQQLAASDQLARRAIATGRSHPELTPAVVLATVDTQALIGPVVLLFDRVHAAPGERSEALYQTIVLDSASFPLRQHTAFLCVRRHADEITNAHGRAIVRRCLTMVSQPIDPYSPVALTMAARSACAALVSRNPSLDSEVLERLQTGEVALVQAAALQARRVKYSEGIIAVLKALSPGEQRALGFTRDCDRQYSALDPAAPPLTRWERCGAWARTAAIRFVVPARLLIRALVVLALPAVGVCAAFAFDAWVLRLPDHVEIGSGEALAALGILVAVHVLSAELSADRLAGPIARASSFPVALQAGYLAGLMLLVRSVLHPRATDLHAYSEATLGLMTALVVLVIVALLTLLRRTDPVRAVEAFVRRQRTATLAAGRTLGRMQRNALRQRELLSGFAWASSTLTAPRGERREAVRARRSGYLLLRERRLRRIGLREEFRQERLRIAMVAVIGLPVGTGDEVFSLIPAQDATLTRRDVRRAQWLVRTRVHRDIDEVSEHVGILLDMATTQARAGNVAGAERVRDAALSLLLLHLRGVRSSRGLPESDEPIGLIPALRTAAVQSVRALTDAPDANTREILLGFLQRLLELTDTADGFAATLAIQLGLLEQPLRETTTHQLLWDCGARAIEVDDGLGLRAVREQIERLLGHERRGVELGGQLVQLAAITRADRARALWRWHERRCREHKYFPLTAMRVGASALSVGNASLALTVALSLRGHDADEWLAYFEKAETADAETVSDQVSGHLLGADPQFALQEFTRFLGGATAAVPALAVSATSGGH
jgi:hypothetical protein